MPHHHAWKRCRTQEAVVRYRRDRSALCEQKLPAVGSTTHVFFARNFSTISRMLSSYSELVTFELCTSAGSVEVKHGQIEGRNRLHKPLAYVAILPSAGNVVRGAQLR